MGKTDKTRRGRAAQERVGPRSLRLSAFAGLGQALKALRQRRGLSAAEAARRTGIDPSNLTKYERDARGIKAETLDRILAGYEATLDELAAVLKEVQGGPAVRWIVPGKLSEADLLLMRRIVLGDNGAPDEPKKAKKAETPDQDPPDGGS